MGFFLSQLCRSSCWCCFLLVFWFLQRPTRSPHHSLPCKAQQQRREEKRNCLDRENRALCVATFLPVFSFFPPRRSCCNNASMSGSMAPAGDVTSSGLIAGDDPLHYALLLLIVQVAIIIVLSRFITFLFSPLRQPRVVAGTPSLSRFCWCVCVFVCVHPLSLCVCVSVSVAVL